jgi:hypothetical protein
MNSVILSNAQREQLVDVLRELQASPGQGNRRHPRRRVRQAMWLKRPAIAHRPTPQMFSISATDVSKGGIGFHSRRELAHGEQVIVPLQFREGGGMLVLCSVRYCRPLEGGHFHIGASFVETVDDPDGATRIPRHWMQGRVQNN